MESYFFQLGPETEITQIPSQPCPHSTEHENGGLLRERSESEPSVMPGIRSPLEANLHSRKPILEPKP